jgi:transposase
MEHLEDITIEQLQSALDTVERKKPAQRLITAIAYKQGVTQTELSEWYGVQRRTIYDWLRRLEDEPLTEAVKDDPRPGRPRKLTSDQYDAFVDTLHESPTEAGLDEPTWTPELVRQYLAEEFGVEYSIPSCRRLMSEAGLQYHEPPPVSDTVGKDDGDEPTADQSAGWWTT